MNFCFFNDVECFFSKFFSCFCTSSELFSIMFSSMKHARFMLNQDFKVSSVSSCTSKPPKVCDSLLVAKRSLSFFMIFFRIIWRPASSIPRTFIVVTWKEKKNKKCICSKRKLGLVHGSLENHGPFDLKCQIYTLGGVYTRPKNANLRSNLMIVRIRERMVRFQESAEHFERRSQDLPRRLL